MANDMHKFEAALQKVAPLFWKIDWSLPNVYSDQKACVCAAFAKIAYLNIPSFEVKEHDRAKIIPCIAYQSLIKQKQHVSLWHRLRRALGFFEVREENLFTFQTRYVVVVGVVTPKVIFIALRGTVPLHMRDWIIDFDARMLQVDLDTCSPTFHRGFYFEITNCLARITSEIKLRTAGASHIPVYVVGHSLGGALAGILHALGGSRFMSKHCYETIGQEIIRTHSSFTFGMPRYGDDVAVYQLPSPFHVYNNRDIVPSLVPWEMGYTNVPEEYRAHVGGRVVNQSQMSQTKLRGFLSHPVERYLRRLGKAAGIVW